MYRTLITVRPTPYARPTNVVRSYNQRRTVVRRWSDGNGNTVQRQYITDI
ncbi:MAG: hypothetical protein LBM62_00760 [Mediterranea sp.]|nr:hypothetical protein [Mediterranea sp.]